MFDSTIWSRSRHLRSPNQDTPPSIRYRVSMSFRSFGRAFLRGGWRINRFRNADRHRRRTDDAIPSGSQAHVRPMLHVTALVAVLLPVTPSFARDYATRDVGQWVVSASSDGEGCFLTRIYQGPGETTLMLGLDVDGGNRLTILNTNWSVRQKEQLRLNFRLSNAAFPRHLAVGIAADGKKGIVTRFGTAFPGNFAASRFLHVTRGDVPVAELSLDGSGAAVAELRRCVDRYRGKPSAAGPEQQDAGRIPMDPFAVHSGRKSKN